MLRLHKVLTAAGMLIVLLATGIGGLVPSLAQTRPGNYVQRVIVCTTSVFREPGGAPVSGAVIQKGQSWYVNPSPTAPDRNGRRWTAIWVSGIGYIPAECVGGQENLAPGAGAGTGSTGTGAPVTGGAVSDGARGTVTKNAAGQTIYIVAAGDRLYRIALRFGVTVGALQAANKIGNANLIYPGMQLVIPK